MIYTILQSQPIAPDMLMEIKNQCETMPALITTYVPYDTDKSMQEMLEHKKAMFPIHYNECYDVASVVGNIESDFVIIDSFNFMISNLLLKNNPPMESENFIQAYAHALAQGYQQLKTIKEISVANPNKRLIIISNTAWDNPNKVPSAISFYYQKLLSKLNKKLVELSAQTFVQYGIHMLQVNGESNEH